MPTRSDEIQKRLIMFFCQDQNWWSCLLSKLTGGTKRCCRIGGQLLACLWWADADMPARSNRTGRLRKPRDLRAQVCLPNTWETDLITRFYVCHRWLGPPWSSPKDEFLNLSKLDVTGFQQISAQRAHTSIHTGIPEFLVHFFFGYCSVLNLVLRLCLFFIINGISNAKCNNYTIGVVKAESHDQQDPRFARNWVFGTCNTIHWSVKTAMYGFTWG